jgi:hypothetical protein
VYGDNNKSWNDATFIKGEVNVILKEPTIGQKATGNLQTLGIVFWRSVLYI